MPAKRSLIAHSSGATSSARKCRRAIESLPLRIGHALAQVQQEAAVFLFSRVRNARASLASTSAMRPCASNSVRVVGALDVAHDAAVETLHAGIAAEHDALAGGDTAEQAFALDIADQWSKQRGLALGVAVLAHDRHRTADELAVVGVVRPLAAVLEQLRHRAPQRQRVVAEVVVQLDQAGEERAAGLDRRHILEAGGRQAERGPERPRWQPRSI